MDSRVQLRFATLPSLFRPIAVHHWFAVWDPEADGWRRWEVWQNRAAGGTSWGHVHRGLMPADRGVGGGRPVVAAEWRGDAARALAAVLADPLGYPHRERYRFWPGPNSNTYAAWALREAGIPHDFDPRAVGKDYLGFFGARRSAAERVLQVETPLLGLRLGGVDGLELHLLGLTFGLSLRSPALKTPFGRLPP
jgi:hypothetical protein